ncbi:MAG: GAF domain-containing protein [Acidobacteria bacterium]|nr:GAF domain-containing protein [Acidobacteriota bacterium]
MAEEGKDNVIEKGREILRILEESKEFTRRLLKENERLRFQNVSLAKKVEELTRRGSKEVLAPYLEEIDRLKKELADLRDKYAEVERENMDFAQKYIEVEEQNNNLANLYIASYQLHSTLDFKEVVQIICEIVINLIGAEVFTIFLFDEKRKELGGVAGEGRPSDIGRYVPLGEGVIGWTAEKGEIFILETPEEIEAAGGERPIACIPLKIKKRLIGVIVVYKLFVQKRKGFTPMDRELFSLLAGHAATALYSAKLYSSMERKLNTIESFMELLASKQPE